MRYANIQQPNALLSSAIQYVKSFTDLLVFAMQVLKYLILFSGCSNKSLIGCYSFCVSTKQVESLANWFYASPNPVFDIPRKVAAITNREEASTNRVYASPNLVFDMPGKVRAISIWVEASTNQLESLASWFYASPNPVFDIPGQVAAISNWVEASTNPGQAKNRFGRGQNPLGGTKNPLGGGQYQFGGTKNPFGK